MTPVGIDGTAISKEYSGDGGSKQPTVHPESGSRPAMSQVLREQPKVNLSRRYRTNRTGRSADRPVGADRVPPAAHSLAMPISLITRAYLAS
jgi:hypothetical protein